MRPFVDTNILVYAATADDPHKQQMAQRLLADHTPAGLTISTQVLAETYNMLTHRKRWVSADALQAVRILAAAMRTVSLAPDQVLAALQLASAHSLSTCDAMVIHAAMGAGCDTLFSEDLQAGRRFGALQVVNPFVLAAHEAPRGTTLQAATTPKRKPARKAGPRAVRGSKRT